MTASPWNTLLTLCEPASGPNSVRPKLTVFVHLQDGIAVDASLTPTSRAFLNKLASEIPDNSHDDNKATTSVDSTTALVEPLRTKAAAVVDNGKSNPPRIENGDYETLEVPLVFDSEFFDLLQNDVNKIDALQAEEQKQLTTAVMELGKEVSAVSKPSRLSKSDLARWRQIFELYLDANVFFATQEQDHGARSSQKAVKQLQWFQTEVDNRGLAKHFKIQESQEAYNRFLQLNLNLLKNLQFQELNRLAVSKILKSM